MTKALRISRRRLLRGVGTLGVALAAGCGPGPLTVVPSPTPRLRRIGLLALAPETVERMRRGLGELGSSIASHICSAGLRWREGAR